MKKSKEVRKLEKMYKFLLRQRKVAFRAIAQQGEVGVIVSYLNDCKNAIEEAKQQ